MSRALPNESLAALDFSQSLTMASNHQPTPAVTAASSSSSAAAVAAAAAGAGEGSGQRLEAAAAYVKQFLAEQQQVQQQQVQQQQQLSPGEPGATPPGSDPPLPSRLQRPLQTQPPPTMSMSNSQLLNQYLGLGLGVPGAVVGPPHQHQHQHHLHLQQHHLQQQQQQQQQQGPLTASSALFLPPQLTLLLADYLNQQEQNQQHPHHNGIGIYNDGGRLLLPPLPTLPPAAPAMPPPPPATTTTTNNNANNNSMLANLQQAHQAAAAAAASPSPHHPPPPRHHRQQQHAPPPHLAPQPAFDAASQQQQQHLLASALLLSSVNPGLAAAAMAQALTMQQQQPTAVAAPADAVAAALQAPKLPQHHPPHLLHHQAQAASQLQQLQHQTMHQQVQMQQVLCPISVEGNDDQGAVVAVAGVNPSNRSSPADIMMLGIAAAAPSSSPSSTLHPPIMPVEPVTAATPAASTGDVMVHTISNGSSMDDNGKRNDGGNKSTTKKTKLSRSGSNKPAAARRLSSSLPGGGSTTHLPARRLMSIATTTSSLSQLPAIAGTTMPFTSSPVNVTSALLISNASAAATCVASGGVGGHALGLAKGNHIRGHPNPVAAATVAGAAASSSLIIPSIPITTMQRWSLEKLDTHIKLYRAANQSVPQAIALLVADLRRKEEKRHAKRLANRKSACTSRARKKALIDEMTRENARLRRQALILSYLPDPVVAIRADGVITFCSMQVERVLRHDASELLGANIEDIIVPNSRESIRRLIRDLVLAEQRALLSTSSMEDEEESGENRSEEEEDVEYDGANENISASTTAAMPQEVSEHSSDKSSLPPLLEVKVKSDSTEVAVGEDVSDSSGDDKDKKVGNQQQQRANNKSSVTSSLTHKNSSLSDDAGLGNCKDQTKKVTNTASSSSEGSSPSDKMMMKEEKPSTEDESTSSENKANANLTKNVEMCKLNKDKEDDEQVRFSHKDDVMGASVTANNADAKLSSLMHHPRREEGSAAALNVGEGVNLKSSVEQPEDEDREEKVALMRRKRALLGPEVAGTKQDGSSSLSAGSSHLSKKKKQSGGNSSEDSGYRESNESPEESNEYLEDSLTSSDASTDRSSSKKKRRRTRPLAPACNVRFIRNDLSTIWCELTCSIRTRPLHDADMELNIALKAEIQKISLNNNINHIGSNESAVSAESVQEEKELLLCFRPIREGEAVGEELRFCPKIEKNNGCDGEASLEDRRVSSANSISSKDRAFFKNSVKESLSTSIDILSLDETQAATSPPLSVAAKKNRPPKKRKYESDDESQVISNRSFRKSRNGDTQVEEIDEKSAVESMMELARNTP